MNNQSDTKPPEPTASSSTVANTKSRGVSRGTLFFLVALVGLVGFVAGTRSDQIMSSLGPVFGVRVATDNLDLSSVNEVYRQLSAHYDGELDNQKLIDGASRGLVQAAGDEYTAFMDAEEAEQFNEGLSGTISGIGAEIGVRADVPTILRVLDGSPAEQAGVRPQDQVLRVNDTITTQLDAARTAELIRGESGTTVRLELLRGEETVKYSITRAQVSDPSVDTRLDGQVAIIKLRRFDRDTGTVMRQQVERLLDQGARYAVLDLRDNGGGYLEQAPLVSGLWLDGEVVVSERSGDERTQELVAKGEPILANIPTVVLVNGSTASASEIVAGALQDHEAATILGEETYGKGSVQQVLRLGGGRQLKVTVARWYTPSGASISEKGIAPDVEVELTTEDFNQGNDPQLKAARDRLTN